MGSISLKQHYLRFVSVSFLMTRQRCKCEEAAKAGCGSAGYGEPAYSAHQSCRKSPKLLPEAQPVPTAQINSCLASFHGHSVSSSSPLLPSARCLLPPDLRHCRLCRPLEHAWGSTCVCLVFGWCFFFLLLLLIEAPHHDLRLLAISSPNPCAALAV